MIVPIRANEGNGWTAVGSGSNLEMIQIAVACKTKPYVS